MSKGLTWSAFWNVALGEAELTHILISVCSTAHCEGFSQYFTYVALFHRIEILRGIFRVEMISDRLGRGWWAGNGGQMGWFGVICPLPGWFARYRGKCAWINRGLRPGRFQTSKGQVVPDGFQFTSKWTSIGFSPPPSCTRWVSVHVSNWGQIGIRIVGFLEGDNATFSLNLVFHNSLQRMSNWTRGTGDMI